MGAVVNISQLDGNKPTLFNQFLQSFIENFEKLTGKVRAIKKATIADEAYLEKEVDVNNHSSKTKLKLVYLDSYGSLAESQLLLVDSSDFFKDSTAKKDGIKPPS